jgi:hypothetical protein
MSTLKTWLKHRWLRAQGVPEHIIWENGWKNPTRFEVYPPHCIVCERAWRPDKPLYIAIYGESYRTSAGLRWRNFPLRIYHVTTGIYGPSIRHLCREHGNKYAAVEDCVTGQPVKMERAPSDWQRAWRDVSYWTGSALRFAFLIAQWVWLWLRYKVCGYSAEAIRSPWPPLRRAGREVPC